jgi:hypothetical protein
MAREKRKPPAKAEGRPPQPAPAAVHDRLSVFPHRLHPGDRVTVSSDQEREVADHPKSYLKGKMIRISLRAVGGGPMIETEHWPAHKRVAVRRDQANGELLVGDGDGKLVYRLNLPCDPVADPAYLKALAAGEQVSAIACEQPGSAKVFYAKTIDELKKWAARVRGGDGQA